MLSISSPTSTSTVTLLLPTTLYFHPHVKNPAWSFDHKTLEKWKAEQSSPGVPNGGTPREYAVFPVVILQNDTFIN